MWNMERIVMTINEFLWAEETLILIHALMYRYTLSE